MADFNLLYLKDDGLVPNNKLPLIVYKSAFTGTPGQEMGKEIEAAFHNNNWQGSWWSGIFSFHHYHSTAHEVLGVYNGSAKVQLGGQEGERLEVFAGDVIVIPAGVAHKRIESEGNFGVIGAYPNGMSYDMNYCKPEERPLADKNIANVPVPATDPVYGKNKGALVEHWE